MPKQYRVMHNFTGMVSNWYLLETSTDLDKAMHCARNYALANGGFVSVQDASNRVYYGSHPEDLQRAQLLRNRIIDMDSSL